MSPNATAIVAILIAPVEALSRNKLTIDITLATIIGIKIEVMKKPFVALILIDMMNV
jgi:hypothetical protein